MNFISSDIFSSYFLLPFKLSLWNFKYEWAHYQKYTPYIPPNIDFIVGLIVTDYDTSILQLL